MKEAVLEVLEQVHLGAALNAGRKLVQFSLKPQEFEDTRPYPSEGWSKGARLVISTS